MADSTSDSNTSGLPRIVLIPHQRSHQFTKRDVILREPTKVGRSVARTRILPSNLIFDCRVLSRSHALVTYENGKFFIQDTKSSNGTFVNDSRLSRSGEESLPYELKSGDLVQFGVNVEGPSRVTHGCIIGTVKLYLGNTELLSGDSAVNTGQQPVAESFDEREIEEVIKVVQDAYRNELDLELKLAKLQDLLKTAQSMANDNMMAIVKEDQLLSRLEMMENQLQLCTKDLSEDDLKEKLRATLEEKLRNEDVAKEKIIALTVEKTEKEAQLFSVQQQLGKAEEGMARLKKKIDQLVKKHQEEQERLLDQIKQLEKQYSDLETKTTMERSDMSVNQDELKQTLKETQENLEKVKGQLDDTLDELEKVKLEKEALQKKLENEISNKTTTEYPLELLKDGSFSESLLARFLCETAILKGQLSLMEEMMSERDEEMKKLKVQLSSGPIAVSERNVQEGSKDAVTMTLVPNVDGKRDTIPSATRKVPHEVHALKVQLDQILAKSKKAEKELASIVDEKESENILLIAENAALKSSNAQLLEKIQQLEKQCDRVQSLGDRSDGSQRPNDPNNEVNPLVTALIWCSVGVAVASAIFYFWNHKKE